MNPRTWYQISEHFVQPCTEPLRLPLPPQLNYLGYLKRYIVFLTLFLCCESNNVYDNVCPDWNGIDVRTVVLDSVSRRKQKACLI